MPDDKKCFVIAPIGDPESDTRKRSDQVLKHVIKPAVSECGYEAIRADEIDKPGIITSQVIQHVVDDPLVIADLTERNPNVFYELAIRHALRKPFIQLMKKGEQIPFDVAATRTIFVDHQDLDSVAEAKKKIVDQIEELEKDPSDIETPISVSLDIQLLRQSEKPEDRSLADLVAAVSNIRADLGKLETKIDNEDVLNYIRDAIGRLLHQFDMSSAMSSRQDRRFHPMVIEGILEQDDNISPSLEILFIGSIFRDTFPWIYELGLESSNLIRSGDITQALRTLKELGRVVELSMYGPLVYEYIVQEREDMLEFLSGLEHRINRIISRVKRMKDSE